MPNLVLSPPARPDSHKGLVPITKDQHRHWDEMARKTYKLRQSIQEKHPDDYGHWQRTFSNGSCLMNTVNHIKDLVEATADYLDCGTSREPRSKEPQKRQRHIADNLRDLCSNCDNEDLPFALEILLETIHIMKEQNVKSAAIDNIEVALTDGNLDNKVRNFTQILEIFMNKD